MFGFKSRVAANLLHFISYILLCSPAKEKNPTRIVCLFAAPGQFFCLQLEPFCSWKLHTATGPGSHLGEHIPGEENKPGALGARSFILQPCCHTAHEHDGDVIVCYNT